MEISWKTDNKKTSAFLSDTRITQIILIYTKQKIRINYIAICILVKETHNMISLNFFSVLNYYANRLLRRYVSIYVSKKCWRKYRMYKLYYMLISLIRHSHLTLLSLSRFRGRDKCCRLRSVRFNSASFSFRFESIYFLKISIRNRFGIVFVLINHLNNWENYLLKRIYCHYVLSIVEHHWQYL
jgi:hypothetical protein